MPELRKDLLFDKWALFAEERKKRPNDFKKNKKEDENLPKLDENCPFCPGNEDLTPAEIDRVEEAGHWVVRCFPNKFAAVHFDEKLEEKQENFFYSKKAIGKHEVIVESPIHNQSLGSLSVERISQILEMYQKRFTELMSIKGTKEVNIFKNFGQGSGASLAHSHTQIVSLNQVSPFTEKDLKLFEEKKTEFGISPYLKLIEIEKNSPRAIFENNSFIAIAPFASSTPLEVMILPKKQYATIADVPKEELKDFATILKKILFALEKLPAAYNFFIRNGVEGKEFHFYLKIQTRLALKGGFEEQTGIIINSFIPEDVADFFLENEWS